MPVKLSVKKQTAIAAKWYTAKQELRKAKEAEAKARADVAAMFVDPVEGSKNTLTLADGSVLKMTHRINRNIDEAGLHANQAEFDTKGLSTDELVKTKLTLSKGAYNKLNATQRKLFDRCLVITEGAPTIKVIAADIG